MQLIVYCHYTVEGEVKTSFLHIAELRNGLAVTIREKILSDLCRATVGSQKGCGLGSDGTLVTLGVYSGVQHFCNKKYQSLYPITVLRTALPLGPR